MFILKWTKTLSRHPSEHFMKTVYNIKSKSIKAVGFILTVGLILHIGGIPRVQISLRERDILYALKPQKRLFQGINYCLLVAKQYIYVAAKNEDPFCFSGYLDFLKNKLEIEKTQIRDLVSI